MLLIVTALTLVVLALLIASTAVLVERAVNRRRMYRLSKKVMLTELENILSYDD